MGKEGVVGDVGGDEVGREEGCGLSELRKALSGVGGGVVGQREREPVEWPFRDSGNFEIKRSAGKLERFDERSRRAFDGEPPIQVRKQVTQIGNMEVKMIYRCPALNKKEKRRVNHV